MFRTMTVLILVLLSSISAAANAFKLPDTGQTKCYQAISPYAESPCAGTGQDGAYNINPMSFTDNGNGTITDNNTGLTWQKCSVGQNNDAACSGTAQTYNWYQASGVFDASYNSTTLNICGALILGGASGWRLPSKKELMGIVDYSIPSPGPMIQQSWFSNSHAYYYWSSTTLASYSDNVWSLELGSGFVFNNNKNRSAYVRCVRDGQ